jgi:tRNA wybutosine-synthesizing protein 1
MPSDVGITDWDQTRLPKGELDEPSLIVEESLKAHRRALIGYKGDPNVDKSLLELALNPVHVAISLEGEVTLYPKIGDLIREYFRSGFKTVFLVTNGLSPKAIDELTCEPSQLYVSVCAPNKKVYHEVCRPLVKDGWKRLNETLELLETLSCPTVMRITLVRHLNLKDVNGYARIARKANSTYLEPKAAMSIGFFLKRIPKEYMPTHGEVKSFAQRLSELTGYNIIDEAPPSRVVLLSKLIKPVKLVN